ncbi:uncharacterized protein RHIMIDRAFT_311168 [Rhizopus microsporus ATCC 52813]|uniref:Uncharacterized protein n=1 Tax=Rhizopus microsporus ATCC 52813 TaxID=1340429 RepID=A0A2G4T6V9_RHIZD|nr:uncharacterized protein RHIMIDRAFT_311168 [Rhizopus microsporus ATCC 52813]PHZ16753.1 hypothetical protein RHIMIDRAFT_311168 [Rhizopus microsporus ATCC 52813]
MADSNSTSFGSVFASGIQDVAAVAAVLGTGICDTNAGLALTKGYLFPAACGMSMFGVLGLAKHGLKSFLPLHVAKNLGIEVEKFDTHRIDKKIHKVLEDRLSFEKRTRLNRQNVKIRMTLLLHLEDTPDSSDTYIYFPLLLAFSSFATSFVCWFDAAIMLSGPPSLYTLATFDMDPFEPHYFGNLLTRRIGYGIGLLAAVGTNMTSTDTYYWLGLELTLCFLRLVIWSWNTEKDDLNVTQLRYKIDRNDEGIIKQIQELPLSRSKVEDAISNLKLGGYFIQSEIVDAYYQARYHVHDLSIPYFNQIHLYTPFRSSNTASKISYVKTSPISSWVYYFKGNEFEPQTGEQLDVRVLEKLKSEIDFITPWIKLVTSHKQVDPEAEEDEQMYKYVELESYRAKLE